MDPNYEQLSGVLSKEDPCYEALGGSNAGSDADPCYERVLHHPHLHHNGGRELPPMSDEANDPNYERYIITQVIYIYTFQFMFLGFCSPII